jgi:hypothetical protein
MSEPHTLEDGVLELLRKKAALAGQVAFQHFRLLNALKAAAAHARRTGNVLDAGDLDDQYRAIDVYSQHVSNVADNAHAAWDVLRRTTSAKTPEPSQRNWRQSASLRCRRARTADGLHVTLVRVRILQPRAFEWTRTRTQTTVLHPGRYGGNRPDPIVADGHDSGRAWRLLITQRTHAHGRGARRDVVGRGDDARRATAQRAETALDGCRKTNSCRVTEYVGRACRFDAIPRLGSPVTPRSAGRAAARAAARWPRGWSARERRRLNVRRRRRLPAPPARCDTREETEEQSLRRLRPPAERSWSRRGRVPRSSRRASL